MKFKIKNKSFFSKTLLINKDHVSVIKNYFFREIIKTHKITDIEIVEAESEYELGFGSHYWLIIKFKDKTRESIVTKDMAAVAYLYKLCQGNLIPFRAYSDGNRNLDSESFRSFCEKESQSIELN